MTEDRGAERSALSGIVIVIAACGGPAVVATTHHDSHDAIDASASASASAAIDAGPNRLEMLLARHDRVAPGTREITHVELDLAEKHELVLAAFEADTCIRVLFDADAPTAVMLMSGTMTLSAVDGSSGALGAAGPVCFHKGDVATIRFTGQSHARVVVWASP